MFRGQGGRTFFSCLQHITIYKFWPWSSLSSLVPNTGSFLYGSYKHLHPMMSLASHSLTTQCSGLAEGPQMVPISLQKSQLCPRKPESKKWQFPDSKPSREKGIKKPVRKAGMAPLSPLPYMMRNTLKKTSLRPKRYVYHVLQYSLWTFQRKISSLMPLGLSYVQLSSHSTLATVTSPWFPGSSQSIPTPGLCTPACPVWNTLAGYVTPSLTFLRSPFREHLLRDPPGWLYHKHHMPLVTLFTLIQPWSSF